MNEVGQKLAKQSHRSQLPWTFTVLDSPEVNAFALPGGYVYVTRGIMAYLDSEAELAGVIGHEIGHVTARHGAQRATRQQNAGLGVLAATVLGAVLEGAGCRRRHADWPARSRRAWPRAGWPPTAASRNCRPTSWAPSTWRATATTRSNMVDVIGVLKSQERFAADLAQAEGRAAPSGANWLSSHPSNDQRLADIRRIAAGYQGDYADDGRTRYLQAIDGMSFGESRAQGVTRGRNFFHEELGIALTAPQGWRIAERARRPSPWSTRAGDAGLIVQLVPPKAGKHARRDHPQPRQADRGPRRAAHAPRPGGDAVHRRAAQRRRARRRPCACCWSAGRATATTCSTAAPATPRPCSAPPRGLAEAEASFRAAERRPNARPRGRGC